MLRTITIGTLAILMCTAASARDQLVVGAMGDSISTGFNAQRLGDNRDLSWSTGTAAGMNSYRKRIEATRGVPVVSFNEAIAGSVSVDLERQTTRLLRNTPNFVTITIGANDVCGWANDYEAQRAAFQQKVTASIDRLVAAKDDMVIVLAPIPSLYNLWEVAHTQSGCQERWELFNTCQALLGRDVTEAQRQAFVGRWEHANRTLAEVAAAYPDNVRFDPAMAETRFEWHHVSTMDCFHPSVAGQNLLAEMAWQMILDND